MSERTTESAMTVEEDGIRVEKSFTDDEFPVPAITYDLSSDREEPARVRIVDTIPESFPMDRVGFHPEYESDNWTAYKDHRVEFERVLKPEESAKTVFGIRSDDPDIDGFLGAPVIEHVPVGEEIEDVLGTGETDAVREVLSGDRTTLPGMERESASTDDPLADDIGFDRTDDPLADDIGSDRDDEVPVKHDPARGDAEQDEDTDEDAIEADPDPRTTDPETTSAITPRSGTTEKPVEETDPVDPESEFEESPDAEPGSERVVDSGIAAMLAAEIRSGDVDDDDLELLRSELDVGLPRSVDVRISRLQSSVADIEAYADALAEFIDEEGSAREVLDELQSRVDEVEAEMTAIDDRADAGEEAREELATDVENVERSVSDLDDDLSDVTADVADAEQAIEEVEDDVASVASDVTELDGAVDDLGDDVETLYEETDDTAAALADTDTRVEDIEERLDRFDAEFDDVWDDFTEVDVRLTAVEDALGDDVEDIEAELADINDHLEELEAFRKRLNEAFGP